jgi:GWxTD domain-containing protein
MLMGIDKFLISCCVLLMVQASWAIDFSRVNIAWQYDPQSEVEVRHLATQMGDSMTVFIKFRFNQTTEWAMEYLIQEKYQSESHSRFEYFTIDSLLNLGGKMILKLKFKKPDENLLVVKIFKEEAFYYYDIPMKNGGQPYSSIYAIDEEGLPIFERYLKSSGFTLVGSEKMLVTRYAENFDMADPPMADMKPLAPSILPDTSFWYTESKSFSENYFYVIREDSNALSGITLLRTFPYYPKQKVLQELTFSMQYILNEPEKKALKNSTNLRESFNSFWLKTYSTQFRARNAIRYYYNWVEQANNFFTDFKQGWKTDRGMMYIVYGGPDEVYRSDSKEEWFYDDGPGFEFSIISTFFSPRTYSLRRNIDLESLWYKSIASIRRGIND